MEIEIKLRVEDLAKARERLRVAGFREVEPRSLERNILFDTHDLALRRNQQMLRVREFRGQALLTFKDKPLSGKYKQREELETFVGSASVLIEMLERLNYQPVFRYEKYRQIQARDGEPAVVAVDETPIGPFLELEGDSSWIDATAALLGYREEDYITASYAGLYLEHCRRMGVEPSHFVFPPANTDRIE